MKKTKKIALLGMGIALYVVLGAMVKIPLIAHIQTDLGYIAFGFMLFYLGWQATIIGVAGCLLESLLFSGWVPMGWMLGQAFIGISCGIAYKKIKPIWINIILTILAVFIGIGLIKTGVECKLFNSNLAQKLGGKFVYFAYCTIPVTLVYYQCKINQEIK